jgi:rhodanese-related sulfurtransferase
MDRDKAGYYIILDVRQPWEYKEGHIPGATLIPWENWKPVTPNWTATKRCWHIAVQATGAWQQQ